MIKIFTNKYHLERVCKVNDRVVVSSPWIVVDKFPAHLCWLEERCCPVEGERWEHRLVLIADSSITLRHKHPSIVADMSEGHSWLLVPSSTSTAIAEPRQRCSLRVCLTIPKTSLHFPQSIPSCKRGETMLPPVAVKSQRIHTCLVSQMICDDWCLVVPTFTGICKLHGMHHSCWNNVLL